MPITLEDVRKWLEESKESDDAEVKEFLDGLKVQVEKPYTAEGVMAFLATDEGKALIQPTVDRANTQAVKTRDKYWEQKIEQDVKQRVAAEVLKLNPQETPEQKQIRELNDRIDQSEKERQRDNLKRQIVEAAAEAGLDAFFVDSYLPASLDEGKLYIQKIIERDKKIKEKITNELMASIANEHLPKGGGGGKGKVDLSKLSADEIEKMEESGELDAALKA